MNQVNRIGELPHHMRQAGTPARIRRAVSTLLARIPVAVLLVATFARPALAALPVRAEAGPAAMAPNVMIPAIQAHSIAFAQDDSGEPGDPGASSGQATSPAAPSPFARALPELLRALPGVPEMLGMVKPHTYLILVQNNHELRPSGGFITAVGRVTLDKGRISAMDFADSYSIFTLGAPYPPAPKAMLEHMEIPYLTFRDSNWSPDLATTAAIARTLYTMDTGQDFDTLVTLDLNAAQGIVEALGPIHLEGVAEPVTGENIVEIMKELWARPLDSQATVETDATQWWRERKDFIPNLAQAALEQVTSGRVAPLELASAVVTALDQRDIQIVTDAEKAAPVADALANLGWDGALQPRDEADFLALVDMNMGYNKADAAIERALDYTVEWPEDGGAAEATAVVTYTHTYTGAANLCEPKPQYGAEYDDMIERCYFDFARLYVPSGSELIAVDGVDAGTVGDQRSEQGTRSFAGYFSLKPAAEKVLTFRYRLPEGITPENYSLRIQRQSGSNALPVRLRVGEWSEDLLLEDGRFDWSPRE